MQRLQELGEIVASLGGSDNAQARQELEAETNLLVSRGIMFNKAVLQHCKLWEKDEKVKWYV